MDLRVGNGARVATVEIGDYLLTLPSRLILELNKCYYVLAMCRNIISISCLDTSGFDFTISNSIMHFRRNGILYGSATIQNDLYILDMSENQSVYNIDT